MSLRCGRIRYTNALPLYAAFDAGAVVFPGSLHAGVPSRLNAMLLDGDLDLGPMSAYAWARHGDDLVLLPGPCIAARDAVLSVLLASPVPPALLDGAAIAVTPDSESGRNLLRVLLERRYGVQPVYAVDERALEHARAGGSALLIGDAALDAAESLPPESIYDLGHLWREWTGCESVFAVWAARRDAFERDPSAVRACLRAFADAYGWSRANAAEVIARAQAIAPRPADFYRRYYEALKFEFDATAQDGLQAFCRELLALGAIRALPECIPEAADAVAP